jgi:hypothetical protein
VSNKEATMSRRPEKPVTTYFETLVVGDTAGVMDGRERKVCIYICEI